MTDWRCTLNVRDVFHNDSVPFEQMRDTVAARIKKLPAYVDDNDFSILDVVEGLASAEDVAEFDEWWSEFYDWADRELVWVRTR